GGRAATRRQRGLLRRLETAGAASDEDRVGVAIAVADHQVGMAIVVHIADRDPDGSSTGGRGDWRQEGAVSIPEQDGHAISAAVRADQVQISILIDIGGHEVGGSDPYGIDLRQRETAGAVVEEDRYGPGRAPVS